MIVKLFCYFLAHGDEVFCRLDRLCSIASATAGDDILHAIPERGILSIQSYPVDSVSTVEARLIPERREPFKGEGKGDSSCPCSTAICREPLHWGIFMPFSNTVSANPATVVPA